MKIANPRVISQALMCHDNMFLNREVIDGPSQ
jgi:hypothetical protein